MHGDGVVLSYDLPTSSAHAFLVYVDRIGRWWPGTYTADPATYDEVVIEPYVGGRVYVRYTDGQEQDWGQVRELRPGQVLAHTFSLSAQHPGTGLVRVEFDDQDSGCRMTFRHQDHLATNPFERHKFGDWPVVLAEYIETVRALVRSRS